MKTKNIWAKTKIEDNKLSNVYFILVEKKLEVFFRIP